MAVSAQQFTPVSYNNVPTLFSVYVKVTGAADVDANGFTTNYGSKHLSSVAKNGEGVVDFTFNFPFKDLVGVSISQSTTDTAHKFTSVTAGSQLVKITWVNTSDHSTAKDADAAVIFARFDFNINNVVGMT